MSLSRQETYFDGIELNLDTSVIRVAVGSGFESFKASRLDMTKVSAMMFDAPTTLWVSSQLFTSSAKRVPPIHSAQVRLRCRYSTSRQRLSAIRGEDGHLPLLGLLIESSSAEIRHPSPSKCGAAQLTLSDSTLPLCCVEHQSL